MSAFGDGFILDGVVSKVTSYIDEPDVGTRFSDQWIVKHEISSALVDVIHRISNWNSDAMVLTHDFTTVVGERRYDLPPSIKSIASLTELSENGNPGGSILPRQENNPHGFGWRIEGNQFVFAADPSGAKNYRLYYEPIGDVSLHSDTTGATLATGTWTLPSTVSLGSIDRRAKAYVGHILRVKPASGAIEERIIETHEFNGSDWVITTRTAFSSAITDGTHPYEILPWGTSPFWECVSIRAAIRMGVKLSMSQKDQKMLNMEYNSTLKTALETHEFMQGARVKHLNKDSTASGSYGVFH